MENKKSNKVLIGVIIAIVVLLLVLGYVLFGKKLLNKNEVDNTTTKKIDTNEKSVFDSAEKLKGFWINCDNNYMLYVSFKREHNKDFFVAGNDYDSGASGGIITSLNYNSGKYKVSYLYGTEDGDQTNEEVVQTIDASNIDKDEIIVNNIIYKKLSEKEAENPSCSR